MTDKATDQLEGARGGMAGDFRTMITDSEELLRAAAVVSNEGFRTARTKFEEKLKLAKATLGEASRPLVDKTRETAAATDEYVRANPWAALGIALAAGVVLGFLAAKR